MPVITFIEHDSTKHEVEIQTGISLMEGAVNAGIEGIVAECGGSCSCATCHCYIQEDWMKQVGGPEPMEADMLDAVVDPKSNSRLSCQVTVSDDMEGLVVHVPESQF